MRLDKWPPNSPDLNPLDYTIWTSVVQRVKHRRYESQHLLKEAIERAWETMDEEHVRRVTCSFRKRLEAVVATNGEHQK